MKSYLIYLLDFHSLFPRVFQKWVYLNKQVLIVLLVVFDIKVYHIGHGYKWQICSCPTTLSSLSWVWTTIQQLPRHPDLEAFFQNLPLLCMTGRRSLISTHAAATLSPGGSPGLPRRSHRAVFLATYTVALPFSLCLWYWHCTCGCWGKRRDFWKNTYRYQSLAGHVTKCQLFL